MIKFLKSFVCARCGLLFKQDKLIKNKKGQWLCPWCFDEDGTD